MKKPKEITCYETSDGALHRSLHIAEIYQRDIDDIERANTILRDGGSVGECLRMFGFSEVKAVLDKVNKDTKMVIAHWQCRDTPSYKVMWFDSKTRLKVGGNAGSWSGPYSSLVSLPDLVRYAEDARTVF